jgi:DNA polymerase-3 subunit epsilon|tara:strand:+ start:368 stop:949 length:582 start_codon:yes stop_codon:yes gene_type:complete
MSFVQTIFLDTETTGLYPSKDKLVEIAIVDSSGKVLLDTLVNPGREIGYATSIHGITDDMVQDAPTLMELWPEIRRIVTGHHIVIYNAEFDIGFFPDNLACAKSISCAMERFAVIYGDWNDYFGDYTWQKLTTAAKHIEYQWQGPEHRALSDTLATRALWVWMEDRESNYKQSDLDRSAMKNILWAIRSLYPW